MPNFDHIILHCIKKLVQYLFFFLIIITGGKDSNKNCGTQPYSNYKKPKPFKKQKKHLSQIVLFKQHNCSLYIKYHKVIRLLISLM